MVFGKFFWYAILQNRYVNSNFTCLFINNYSILKKMDIQRALELFTDRENAREAFDKALENAKHRENTVLCFYGVGGIGKTTLLQKLMQKLREIESRDKNEVMFASLDFDDKTERTFVCHYALESLAKQFSEKYKVSFPQFNLCYKKYLEKTEPNKKYETGNSYIGALIQAGAKFIGLNFDSIDKLYNNAEQMIKEWWTKHGKTFLQTIDQQNHNDIYKQLPVYFASDLNLHQLTHGETIVILIDTYEVLFSRDDTKKLDFERDEWIRSLSEELKHSLVVIAGRDKLWWTEIKNNWEKQSKWESILDQHIVGNLSEEDCKTYLVNLCKIENPEIVDEIIQMSKGVPYFLQLSVEAYESMLRQNVEPKPEYFESREEVFDRFKKYLRDYEVSALTAVSVGRLWNRELFECLIKENNIHFPYDQFNRFHKTFSFITVQGNQYTMHSLMRDSFLDKYKKDDIENFQKISKCIFQYYNQKLKDVSSKTI